MVREYRLKNVEDANKESPSRFHIASLKDRSEQAVGKFVKLIFESSEIVTAGFTGERMWVKITERLKKGGYKGTLSNTPFVLKGILEHGEVIEFGPEHVASIES